MPGSSNFVVVPALALPGTTTHLDITRRDGTVLRVHFDTADYPLISRYHWRSSKHRNTFYAHVNVRKADGGYTTLQMHRLLLPDAPEVDHIDGNGLNNRRSNLRSATNAQNSRNRGKRANAKTSHFKGVCFRKRLNKYQARIDHLHLGYFENEVDAALAYNAAAKELHGEYARLNDVSTLKTDGRPRDQFGLKYPRTLKQIEERADAIIAARRRAAA